MYMVPFKEARNFGFLNGILNVNTEICNWVVTEVDIVRTNFMYLKENACVLQEKNIQI